MVEPSVPPSRVGAAAVPDSIFLTQQMMILLGLPGACSTVPHSPVSGNFSSTRGLPLAGPGSESTPLLRGMSLKILFIPSSSRCPVARAETYSTSRKCPPSVTPSPHPRLFQHLSMLPWWPWHRSSSDPVHSPLNSLVPWFLPLLLVAIVAPAVPYCLPTMPHHLSTARRLLNQP